MLSQRLAKTAVLSNFSPPHPSRAGQLIEIRALQVFRKRSARPFPPSLRVLSDISELQCACYVVYCINSILHRHRHMPSFGFKLPVFIFAAVSTLAQTALGQPATPKPIPTNTAPDVATIEHGNSGIKTRGSSQWFPYGKMIEQCQSILGVRRLTDIK